MNDSVKGHDAQHICSCKGGSCKDNAGEAHGRYEFKCFGADGELKWQDYIDNTVTTEGKNALLTNALKGSAYTAAVYVGLISSAGYASVPVVGDTLASHATWTEAGTTNAPTFAARVAATFGTASAGSLATSASSNFTMTGAGTVKGAMIVFNGATSTILNTTGTLYAAGLFSGDKAVVTNDVIQVSYSTSLT